METKGGHNNKAYVCLYECIGTAFLLFGLNCGYVSGNDSVGYKEDVVVIVLLGCIVHFGAISGGHFNPAVTVGVLIREGLDKLP